MKLTKPILALLALVFLFGMTSTVFPVNGLATPPDAQQAQAQESSWTGTVEQKDVQGMKTYVLSTGGQSIPLEPQDKAAEFVGKNVTVTGVMEDGKVKISTIKEA
ncbi:MAG: hypothetical protein KJZ70_03485 [Bryobacterales bacterium]|nr:hypothetical protein [Bryobacterales bacterium]